jgi:hypothetical protein
MLNKKICEECFNKHFPSITDRAPLLVPSQWPCTVKFTDYWPWVHPHEDPPKGCLRRFEQAVAAGVEDVK